MGLYLVVQTGKQSGRKIPVPLGRPVVIGRDPSCQVRLGSRDVSRFHCRVMFIDRGAILEDLGSQNGTIVNETPVRRAVRLKNGDRIEIGPMRFQVTVAKPSGTDEDQIADWLSEEGVQPLQTERDSTADTIPVEPSSLESDTTFHSSGDSTINQAPRSDPGPITGMDSLAEEAHKVIRHFREQNNLPLDDEP